MPRDAIQTRRLDLRLLSVEAIDLLMAGDRAVLESVTGAAFPTPLHAPPLMDDALPFMRELAADPESDAWGPYLMVLRETGEAIGAAGFTGKPEDDGVVTLGYSLYPPFEGRGFASEAAAALVAWAATQPGVRSVQATIPPAHAASQRVAARAGLRRSGRSESDPDEGTVEVWEWTTGAS